MNYITKVKIENFQSHEKSELEFASGLNVIVGPSDQGKSAVVRAIKWVLFNEPRGSEFIRNGASAARVELELSNGFTIIRERSSSKNRYNVINPDGEIKVYEGFGNDIPDEVKSVHGICKVLIDTDSSVCLNIGEQLDAPFLISQTGSTKAKAIGRLTGVHVLDNAIRECLNDIKRETQLVSKYKAEENELTEKLDSYKDLQKIEKQINKCEIIIQKINKLNEKHNKLDKYRIEYSKVNQEINELLKVNVKLKNVESTEDMIEELSNKTNYLNRLKDVYKRLNNVNSQIKSNESVISSTRNINEVSLNLEKVILLEGRKEEIQKLNISYNNIRCSIIEGEKYIVKIKNELESSLKKYEELLKTISKCPVCFSDIDENTIKRIINEYEI